MITKITEKQATFNWSKQCYLYEVRTWVFIVQRNDAALKEYDHFTTEHPHIDRYAPIVYPDVPTEDILHTLWPKYYTYWDWKFPLRHRERYAPPEIPMRVYEKALARFIRDGYIRSI